MKTQNADDIVPAGQLAAYATLAFPLAAAFLSLQVFVPNLYAISTGYSLATIGLVLLVARLWDVFTDPVVGYLSDHTPAAWGRRKIFVVTGAPLVALAVWYLFNPPAEPGLMYLLGWTFLAYAAGTMVIVPMNAWGAELSMDYQQRSRVSGARVAAGLAGTLAALVLPALLGQGDARDVGLALETIGWVVVVTLTLATVLCALFVPDSGAVHLPPQTLRAAATLLREKSPFRQLLAAFALNGIANAFPATLFLMYATHVLDAPESAGMWLVAYFGASIVSVPFWVFCSRRFGKDPSWRASMLIACILFAVTPFLRAGDESIYLAVVLALGVTTGADLILPTSLQADLIDWDAHKTGFRRPGLFFALWGTTTKLAFALAVGIAFPVLDLVGFDAKGTNDVARVTALAFLYGASPIALKLAAVLTMHGYALTRDAHADIQADLARGGAGRNGTKSCAIAD